MWSRLLPLPVLFLCTSALAGGSDYASFLDRLHNPEDVSYENDPTGGPDRFEMLRELGEAFPGKSCEKTCRSKLEPEGTACKLGYWGGIYVMTAYQKATNRVDSVIWRDPNSSLNVEPYAYMKERELGIPCEQSPFIRKFPTRKAGPNESHPPIERVKVCEGWRAYMDAAQHRAGISDRQLSYLFWRAHTLSLMHTYWQKKSQLGSAKAAGVPDLEYERWAGWSRVVGSMIPRMNPSPCADNAKPVAMRLIPNCILGTDEPGKRRCEGEAIYGLSERSFINLTVGLAQRVLASPSLDPVMGSFEHMLPKSHCLQVMPPDESVPAYFGGL